MRIHQCARCEGCGYVTGTFRWEIPWSRWASLSNPEQDGGVFEARACPDCGGTGALIEMDAATWRSRLVSRHGLPRNEYAERVAVILQTRNDHVH